MLESLTNNMNQLTMNNIMTEDTNIANQMEELFSNIIQNDNLAKEIFYNHLDIFTSDINYLSKIQILGIPNIFPTKYLDNEDYIYNKLILPDTITTKINFNEYNSISLNYNLMNLDRKTIIIKANNLFNIIILSNINFHLHNQLQVSKVKNILGFVNNIYYIFNNNIFRDNNSFNVNFDFIDNLYFHELLYGMYNIICQMRMILNHYPIHESSIEYIYMEELHIKKLFNLLNNLLVCIIYIHYSHLAEGCIINF